MSKPVFTIVHPLRQIDDLETINNRISALIEASYTLFDELHDHGCALDKAVAGPIIRAADRGMTILDLVREMLEQSTNGLVLEYRQLSELGIKRMERAA